MKRIVRKHACERCKGADRPIPAHKCPGCRKVKARAWYEANKDKYTAWQKNWRANNPEALSELKKKWAKGFRERNPEVLKERAQIWAKANPEKRKASRKLWKVRHKTADLAQKKRAYSRQNYGEFSTAHRMLMDFKRAINEE